MIPWGEFDILAVYLEYLVTRFQFIDTRTSTGYKSEKKQKRIIQEWDAVDVESQSVKSAGQDMIWFLIIR